MNDVDEARARSRYFAIAFARLAGAALAVLGLVASAGRIDWLPPIAGIVLMITGLIELAIVPRLLARAWRTPPAA